MYDAAALNGVYLKLDRAREHAMDLNRGTTTALARAGNAIQRSDELSTSSRLVYTVVDAPVVDPHWSLVLGDFLTNIRAALDHLAWQLALFGGGLQGRSMNFPILMSGARIRAFSGVSDAAILDALSRVQPGFEAATRSGGLENHGLYLLNRLVNIDKHETLHVVAYVVDRGQIVWFSAEGDPSPTVLLRESGLASGEVAATFDFHGAPVPNGFEPHLGLRFRLDSGPDIPALRVPDLLGLMQRIYQSVEQDVLGRHFAPLFGCSPRHGARLF